MATGTITTAGDQILRTEELRAKTGLTGSGQIIGVISNGVNHIADAQAAGELPSSVIVLSDSRKGEEGIAMLEIIHDIAPGATLVFHDAGGNEEQFIKAIDALIQYGTTILVDDVGWPGNPYFEDGTAASHLDEVLNAHPDLIYISAAGNNADIHYQGVYNPDNSGTHLFSQGKTGIGLTIPAGSDLTAILQWDDPFGASYNDYNLSLVNMKNGDIISFSRSVQDGTADPVEAFRYQNLAAEDITAEVRIIADNSVEPKNLELFLFFNKMKVSAQEGLFSAGDSIVGHAAIPEGVTVAAVPASESFLIEPFSSQGEVTISYPDPEIRRKPDITGTDSVEVSGAGGFKSPFSGTSAAAPHIAGLIALVRSGFSDTTREEIVHALYSSAQDLGIPDWDSVYGYGLADAVAMYDLLKEEKSDTLTPEAGTSQTAILTPIPTQTKIPDQTSGRISGPVTITKPGIYTLSEDISDSSEVIIDIQASDVVLEGGGHIIQGVMMRVGMEDLPLQTGIRVKSPDTSSLQNVTIRDVQFIDLFNGILLYGVNNGYIFSIECTRCSYGIMIRESETIVISDVKTVQSSSAGILVTEKSSKIQISESDLRSGLFGLVLEEGIYHQILETVCSENLNSGILFTRGVSESSIVNSICNENRNGGISLQASFNNTISENVCMGNGIFGLLLSESSANRLMRNQMNDNFRGLNLYYADGNDISENDISFNSASGIFIQPGGSNIFTLNTIAKNKGEGMLISSSVRPDFENLIYNNLFNNEVNIRLQQDSNPSYLWNIEKTDGFSVIGGENIGGNVWLEPDDTGYSVTCIDMDKDGICDIRYEFDGGIDEFPLKYSTSADSSQESGDDDNVSVSNPLTADGWVLEGKMLRDQGNLEEAIAAYQVAVSLQPDSFQALRDMAQIYPRLQKISDGLASIETALSYYPDSSELWATKGDIYLKYEENYPKAADAYENALEIEPRQVHALMNYAFVLDKLGKPQEALDTYLNVTNINPELADAWTKAGNVYSRMEDYSSALRMYNISLTKDPNSAFTWNNKGYTLAQTGEYELAAEAYREALRIDENYSVAWTNLGDALKNLGLISQAGEAYAHVSESG